MLQANEALDNYSTTQHGETSLLEASPVAATIECTIFMGLSIPCKPFGALETGKISFAVDCTIWNCWEYAVAGA
jgi:hypothetical protein